jgi:hypothetical protein
MPGENQESKTWRKGPGRLFINDLKIKGPLEKGPVSVDTLSV